MAIFFKNSLDNSRLSNVWSDHVSYHYNTNWMKAAIDQRLIYQLCLPKWHNDTQESTKGVIYIIYNTNCEYELSCFITH